MFELRWVAIGTVRHLQYRFVTPNVDASGALCPPGEMSDWIDVPTVKSCGRKRKTLGAKP